MADYLINDKSQKFLGKFRVKIGGSSKGAEPFNLFLFTLRICGRQIIFRLIFTNRLRHLEPFGQHEYKRSVDIIDAFSVLSELFVHNFAYITGIQEILIMQLMIFANCTLALRVFTCL